MNNYQQWPSHQTALYKRVVKKNYQSKSMMTKEQLTHLGRLRETQAEIYSDLLKNTDYPDDLAEVIAEQRTINLVLKS